MSGEPGNCPNPPSENVEELQLIDMISYIGWTEVEFAEACMDYHPDNAATYNWHKVLKELWEATYSRIHSFLDLRHKFRYYNDWKNIIDFTLALNKLRSIDAANAEPLTLRELEEDIKASHKIILPSNKLEKDVLWALTSLILHLHNYLTDNPEMGYAQIVEIRDAVETRKKKEEDKREARRLKKAEQRERKRKNRH